GGRDSLTHRVNLSVRCSRRQALTYGVRGSARLPLACVPALILATISPHVNASLAGRLPRLRRAWLGGRAAVAGAEHLDRPGVGELGPYVGVGPVCGVGVPGLRRDLGARGVQVELGPAQRDPAGAAQ